MPSARARRPRAAKMAGAQHAKSSSLPSARRAPPRSRRPWEWSAGRVKGNCDTSRWTTCGCRRNENPEKWGSGRCLVDSLAGRRGGHPGPHGPESAPRPLPVARLALAGGHRAPDPHGESFPLPLACPHPSRPVSFFIGETVGSCLDRERAVFKPFDPYGR